MILQALAERYYDTLNSGNAVPFGWAVRDAVFALDLDESGTLHNLIFLDREENGKRVRREFLLPEAPSGRTVAIKSAFLCDNCKYIFGISEKYDKRDKDRFASSQLLYKDLLSGTDSPAAHGLLNFFENWCLETAAEHPVVAPLLVDKKTADSFYKGRFVFQINGRFAHDDPAIQQVWNDKKAMSEGETVRCLVSGEQDTLMRLHGKVALPGVSMGSTPLVSINADSFTSYGKSSSDPAAQIGEKSAFAYVTALNTLLNDENHRQWLGGDTLVYWAEKGGEQEAFVFSWTSNPKEEDNEKLLAIMNRFTGGEKIIIEDCRMDSRFYLLCLSPNAGRMSVRFFYSSTFGDLIKHNIEHYKNLEIDMSPNQRFLFLPPWILLSETTVKQQSKEASPLLGGQLEYSIISGAPYPLTLYNAILIRIRAGEPINRTKAAIIKAILIRNFKERGVTTVSLNAQTDNKPYVLGRLFATLEYLQQQAADGKLNATIRDRYFTGACANPGSAFPLLLKLSMHHTAKVNKPVYFEKLKGELMDKLDEQSPFPAALDMVDQGRFILGYYHQTQHFYTPNKNKEDSGNE